MKKKSSHYFPKYKMLSTLALLGLGSIANAHNLPSIVNYALLNDPIVLESTADLVAANSRSGQALSRYFPTVRLVGNALALEHHKDKSKNVKDLKDRFNVGAEVRFNLLSIPAIAIESKKGKATEEYFNNKREETKEQLAFTIVDLYLKALKAKDSINVLKLSLQRHTDLSNDLEGIVRQDRGRRSELVQSQSRRIVVEQKVNEQERLLETSLSALSKYVNNKLTVDDLIEPFKDITKENLVGKYKGVETLDSNPSVLVQQSDIKLKDYEAKAEISKLLPAIDLVGTADLNDQSLTVQLNWNTFDLGSAYNLREKNSLQNIASIRLKKIKREAKETAKMALINIERGNKQLSILERQKEANAQVADYYKLQFKVGRKSLLDVLNAENDREDVDLYYIDTKFNINQAILNYLHSQGKIRMWVADNLSFRR